MAKLGTHPATERAGLVTLRLKMRAPALYPTEISSSGSGEVATRSRTSSCYDLCSKDVT